VDGEKSQRRRRWPWIILALVIIYGVWIVITPIRWFHTDVARYPGKIEVRTTIRHELCAYIGMEGVIWPVPWYLVGEQERTVLVNGRECLRSEGTELYCIHPSPAGEYILAVSWLQKQPMRVITTATVQSMDLVVPDSEKQFPGHYCIYPFTFLRWDSDSTFLVEVTGLDSSFQPMKDYRQVWRVDAKTGTRTRVE